MKTSSFSDLTAELVDVGRQLAQWGMVPATSGNFSAKMSNGKLAVTQSGVHKGKMAQSHIMVVDASGRGQDDKTPSAEVLLHLQVYRRFSNVNCVLHVHSKNATLISMLENNQVKLSGYELLKALPNVTSHESEIILPIFENNQDIPKLADQVDTYMAVNNPVYAYLIKGHGMYVWGNTIQQALHIVEALDFMIYCALEMRRL